MPPTLIDSYSESNGDIWYACDSDAADGKEAQSFTAVGASLYSAKWFIRLGGGSPTGNYYAKVYSHSGTYGTSSVPNALLATSEPINAATIPAGGALIEFFFTGANRISLVNGTNYVVVLDGDAVGNTSNYCSVRADTTGAHSGNRSGYSGGWFATSAQDMCFYVYGSLLAEVSTQAPSLITAVSAQANGNIALTGGSTIDERGVVWDTVSRSLPGNVAPASSGYAHAATESGSFGTGTFGEILTGLEADSVYYYRAYAHNANGYVYGDEVSINTLDATIATFSGMDPGNIVKAIIDNLIAQGGIINYSGSSVDLAGYVVSYTFKLNTPLEGIQKMLQMAPSNFYWYVDPATGIVYFKATLTTATHKLIYKKHLSDLILQQTVENIKNIVYFTGGAISGTNLLAKFENPTSRASHRTGLARISDNRVTLYDSAKLLSDDVLNSNADAVYRTTVKIPDSVYDIETFNLGDTVGFQGFGNFIDNLILQIVGIGRSPDLATLNIGTLRPRSTETVESLRRELDAVQTADNPNEPQ